MDALIHAADTALRTLFAAPHASQPCPVALAAPTHLNDAERRMSAGLMRVNHVGEICAQALYTAQALATPNPQLRAHFTEACKEETDHLAWTAERLNDLGARPSLLNPLWYAGAFGLGLLAGRMGDALSLGFVVETERQVGAHLKGHLDRLPAGIRRHGPSFRRCKPMSSAMLTKHKPQELLTYPLRSSRSCTLRPK